MKKFAEGSLFWEIVVKITTGSLVLAIAMSFPLQLFVAVDILEEKIFNPETLHMRSTYWLQNIFRTSLVLGIAFIAVAVPKFGLLTGLIGASGSVTLQVGFFRFQHYISRLLLISSFPCSFNNYSLYSHHSFTWNYVGVSLTSSESSIWCSTYLLALAEEHGEHMILYLRSLSRFNGFCCTC